VPIPLHKLIWENLGANPIGVPYGEVYTAMQTKVIEAVEFNVSSIHAFKMYENADYLTLTGHYYWPGLFFMNKAAYDALSPENQAAVVSACRDQTPAFLDDAKADEAATIEKLKELGMTITRFTDRDKLLELTQPVFDEWSKKDPLIGEYIAAAKAAE
jgi:TRAP-type C4-dicarboxylate transport system substrate-binding protein